MGSVVVNRIFGQLPKIAAKTTKLALAGATGYEVANIVNDFAEKPAPIFIIPTPIPTPPPTPVPTPPPPSGIDYNVMMIMLLVSILLLLVSIMLYYVGMKAKGRISQRAVQRFKSNVGMPA